MHDEHDLIYSALQQHFTVGTHTVEICIYRMPHTEWTLEVIDEHGNSTVWDDMFETDQAAFDEVMRTIRDEGIESLIGEAGQVTEGSGSESNPLRLATPLSDEELEELDAFLLSNDWSALSPGVQQQVLATSQALQDLPTRSQWFLYAHWPVVIVPRLTLSGFWRQDMQTSSWAGWLEARYAWPRFDLALQWQGFGGSPGTVYYAVPQRQALQGVLRVYF